MSMNATPAPVLCIQVPVLCIQVNEETQLRLLEERHAEALLALIARNQAPLQAWIAVDAYAGPVDVLRAYLRQRLLQFVDGEGYHLGIWYLGALVGTLDYRLNRREPTAELGYWLDTAQQGKGLVTQACQIMVRHAFEEHGVQKVEISCAADNLRSRAVAERLGFTLEGTLRRAGWLHGGYVDGVWYGLLVSEWQDQGRGLR
jgi:ribosomal-protein-serine acetyltransferase